MLGDFFIWLKAQFCKHDYRRVHCINGYTYYECSKCGRTRKSAPYFIDYEKGQTNNTK